LLIGLYLVPQSRCQVPTSEAGLAMNLRISPFILESFPGKEDPQILSTQDPKTMHNSHRDQSPEGQVVDTVEFGSETAYNSPAVDPRTYTIEIHKDEGQYQSLWDAANIVGSPQLTSFMEALRIDDEIPLLRLQGTMEGPGNEQLSVVQMKDIWKKPYIYESSENNGSQENHGPRGERSIAIAPQNCSAVLRQNDRGSRNKATGGIFYKFFEAVQISLSPLNEISLFYFHTPTPKREKSLNISVILSLQKSTLSRNSYV